MKVLNKLNPVSKCISIISGAILLSFTFSIELNLAVFFLCFTLTAFFSDAKIKSLALLLIPVFLTAFGLFMTGVLFSTGETTIYQTGIQENMGITSMYNGLQLATRVFAFCGLGMLFSFSTDPIEFVYSLQHQLKLSPKFAYGVLAAFHLIPNVKHEYEQARFALHARGIPCHFFSLRPMFTMFVNAILWAETLSMAMESKGFSSEGPRTTYILIKIKWYDVLFLIIPSLFIILWSCF